MAGPDKNLLIAPHLGDAQIVAYCDGELDSTQTESTRLHVESCWSCRGRMREIQSDIDRFVQAHSMLSPSEPAFSEFRLEQFRQRLARHAAATTSTDLSWQGRLNGWSDGLRRMSSLILQQRKAVLASIMAVCLLIVMFTDVLNTRVSADTVLARAEGYETSHLPASGYVTQTAIRVDRIDSGSHASRPLGTIQLWRDSVTSRIHVSARSASGAAQDVTVQEPAQASRPLMEMMLSAEDPSLGNYLAGQNWLPDLSVNTFRRLIGARGNSDVSARRAGGMFELRYPFAVGTASDITETTLRVDAQEYAPTSLSIFTEGNGVSSEYRFTRTALFAEIRTPEIAQMFPLVAESIHSGPAALSLPPTNRPVPLSYANSRATESEVSVASELHKIDSCLGEEVYLFPMSDGSLLVQGLVDSASRREKIREALKTVSGPFRTEIYVPRELKDGSELYKPPDQVALERPAGTGASAMLADLSGTSVPLHEMLYQHFYKPGASPQDTDKQVALFSDQVVTLARQAFLHAWALKRLDREFSDKRTAGLSAAALDKVEQMREDHRRWITTIAGREAEMLAPVAEPEVTSSVSQMKSGQDSDALLRLAQEQNDLVRSLFTISSQAPNVSSELSRLVSVLKQMGT